MIYRMIRTNTNLKEIQTIATDINRIANSEVLGSETKSFEEVKKEIMLLFETNMHKNSLGVQCFLEDEKSVESLKTKINEIQLIVKSTLRNYRQEVHGLYFVSDEDILSLLCGRIACSELLIQLYSFNEVLIEDDFVTGFSSNGERVLLVDKVNASSNMVDFFDSFAISLERTLNSYLLAKFRDVLRESPPGNKLYNDLKKFCTNNELITINNNQKISVIDDFVNEFCYFNELIYTKSQKIDFIKSLNTKWSDSVHILYPKPKIMNSKIVTQELKTNCIYPVYYPPSEIIFTELTSNIFSLITLGLAKTSGVILYGKSGTGKTETVKYYCRTILRPVYVFCCSKECDINTLENIIIGCIKMNSYLCLDEFNRLDKSTMSSVTELIFQHKEEVKFFLTMNLGYTGRNNLPSSLKSIFTEIKVDNPDVSDILKIFIPKHYDKIMEFLGYLENNCEKHEHYNFGLRAINTIRNNNLSLEDISRLFNIEVSEDTAILYSLYFYYHSTLSKKDKILMSEAFKNFFKVEIASNLSYDIIFTYGLQASSGILIYSNVPTNLIKTIANARDVIIEYYNPPNTINFFGGYDEITGEWVDGEFVTSLKLNRDKEIWYVFDCILNSTWIENFNSVLDDNKSLCLKSGEILKIRPNQKFIFEGQCLKQLTPASLTRLFTIYVENDHSLMPIKFEPCEFDRLLRDNRVVFLVGKGKYTFISSAVKENLVVVDSLNCQSDFFPKIFNKNSLILHNHKKIIVKELVVYFERFEMASLDLQECIREYFIYGKVGDIYPKNLKLICGFDNGEVQSRLLNEANIVEIPGCDPRTYIVNCFNTSDDDNQSLHELIKDPRQVETFINLMLKKLSEGVLELADINKLCKMFKLTLFLDSKESIKCKELVNIYNFISSIFYNTRLTKDDTIQLGFNTTQGFYHKQESCVKDILWFILSTNVPIIIVGHNMCGKRSLVEDCLKDIMRDFKIYNFYEEISYDENGIYLLDSISRVPKMVLRKSLILHLEVPDYICLDYETFYSSLKGNYTSFNHKDKKDYAVYAMHKTSEKHKISCTCCFLQHQKVERIYGKDKNDLFDIFEDNNVIFYDNLHQSTISDTNILIVFESLYKYSEFIEGIEKIYKKSYEDYENRKTYIQECYKRIDEFRKQASELLKESINKKNQLRNLQIQIKSKMDNIVDIQIQMKVEKERICKNQQSLTVVLNKSIEKKKLIDIKMKNTIPLLESSKSKISTISKKHLYEIKTMVKPPEVIKRVIELVYVMLEEQPIDNPNWSFLMQYMRKDDFINKIINFSGIVNLSNIERILKGETIDLTKAYNASQACGILYEWFLANYEYKKVQIEVKPLLDETEEIEKEVRKIKGNLEEEENKYKNLENEINNSKEEFANLQMSLEDLKLEDENLQKKQNLINLTLEMIVNEKDKWHIEEPEDPLRKLKSFDWLLEENKNIFISRNQKVEDELKGRSFLKTSTTHKNFLQVLRSVQEYNTDVIIYDVDFFNPLIYKLLKYQILKQTFSIILISNVNVNFYAHCTYQIDISQKFHLDENVDLEVYEQEFIKTIVEFTDYESIIKSKTTLDNKSKHFLSLKAKREQLESLNAIYAELDKKFKEAYGFGLSFDVFKNHLDEKDDLFSFFSMGLPSNTRLLDFKNEFEHSKEDLTIITSQEESIYEIERSVSIDETISAGSLKNNKKIVEVLTGQQTNMTYLIKNLNLLKDETVKKVNHSVKVIYIIEENAYHSLMANTRILFCPINLNEKESYLKIFGEKEKEAIEFHCKQKETLPITFKDLNLIITCRDVCDEAYLKYLIYETKG